jgi:hypothetical protein
MDTTEIRFFGPHIGFGTELVHNSNPQATINIVKAKIGPDVRILSMKYYSTPSPTDRRDGGTDKSGRRW